MFPLFKQSEIQSLVSSSSFSQGICWWKVCTYVCNLCTNLLLKNWNKRGTYLTHSMLFLKIWWRKNDRFLISLPFFASLSIGNYYVKNIHWWNGSGLLWRMSGFAAEQISFVFSQCTLHVYVSWVEEYLYQPKSTLAILLFYKVDISQLWQRIC
jgi:hypothetical protein